MATLAGTLSIALISDFVPNVDDFFTLLNFNGRTGDFDNFVGLDINDELAFLPFGDADGYSLWTYAW